MLCLIRIEIPAGFGSVIGWLEQNRGDLKPSPGQRVPDGKVQFELVAELADPQDGAKFVNALLTEAGVDVGFEGPLQARVELWTLEAGATIGEGNDSIELTLDLPFCIHLHNGSYSLILDGIPFTMRTEKVWRNSRNSSDDDTVSDQPLRFPKAEMVSPILGEGLPTSGHIGSNVEIKDDPRGRYRFSRITLILRRSMPKDGTEVGQLVDELLPVVNRFVDVYRYVADRAYLPPVQLTDIEQVQVLRPRTGEGQYVFLFGRGYEHGLINENRSVHERVIGMLVSGEQVPLAAELLFAARRLLLEGAWRQAVIEAVAAIEVTVEGLLRRALVVNEGLSEQEFAEFMRAAGGSLSDRMKAPMRRAIKWSPTSQGDLWNRWIAVNKVRRVVVHQGGPATKDQAEEAVAVSSELIRKIETAEAQFLGRA